MNDTSLMEDPTLGDGDDPPDDDLELEFEPEAKDYPWAGDNRAVMLRSFIFQTVVDSNDGIIPNIELMDACFHWIWDGDVRMAKGVKKNPEHLKPVEG